MREESARGEAAIAARLRARQPKRGLKGVSFHTTVRSMSAAFKMWLLDNGLSCGGSARASARHGRSVQDVSFAPEHGHGSLLGMPTFALIPRGAGKRHDGARRTRRGAERWPAEGAERWHWVDATCRSDDEMRSDSLWKGRSGGIGYAGRDMTR